MSALRTEACEPRCTADLVDTERFEAAGGMWAEHGFGTCSVCGNTVSRETLERNRRRAAAPTEEGA